MPPRFFKLYDDVEVPRRWHLGTPVDGGGQEVHAWDFTRGTRLNPPGRLSIPVETSGRPLDFTEAGVMIPVVHPKAAAVFSELAPQDIQLIPASIAGQSSPYQILVVTRRLRCIDEEASQVRFWTPEHGVPDKVGQYIAVDRLHIDKAKVGRAKVFRPTGWEVVLIVAEDLKNALEHIGATGVKFEEV